MIGGSIRADRGLKTTSHDSSRVPLPITPRFPIAQSSIPSRAVASPPRARSIARSIAFLDSSYSSPRARSIACTRVRVRVRATRPVVVVVPVASESSRIPVDAPLRLFGEFSLVDEILARVRAQIFLLGVVRAHHRARRRPTRRRRLSRCLLSFIFSLFSPGEAGQKTGTRRES